MESKFRISFVDFMPQYGKIPIGHKDSTGADLSLGDIVQDEKGEKYYVGYRYGSFMLKQPFTIHYIMPKTFDRYTKINELWGVINECIIIGLVNEPLYDQIKDIENLQIVPA